MRNTLAFRSWRCSAAVVPLVVLSIGLVICPQLWMRANEAGIDQFRLPKELSAIGVSTLAATTGALCLRRLRFDRVVLWLALWLAWAALLAVARADNPWLAWRLIGTYWSAILAYWVARRYAPHRLGGAIMLSAICIAGVVAGLATLLEYLGVWYGWSLPNRAPSGVFGNRNHAAHFVALTLPATLVLLCRPSTATSRALRDRASRSLGYAGALIGVAAITVARTRAAWVATLCGLLVGAILLAAAPGLRSRTSLTRGGRRWVVTAAMGVVLAAILPTPLEWRVAHPIWESAANLANYETGSGRGRLIQYEATLRMALDNPLFGVGPGNWSLRYPAYAAPGDPSVEVENPLSPTDRLPLSDWLGTLAEGGVPAALLLFVVAALVASRAIALIRHSTHDEDRLRGLALSIAIAIIAILGALDAVLQNAATALIATVLVATLSGGERASIVVARGRALRGAGAVAILLPSAFFGFLTIRRLSSVRQYGNEVTMPRLRAAVSADPTDYVARMLLARQYVLFRRCAEARPHLNAAGRLHPAAPAVGRMARACSE
jgi:O-antigen ligase